MSNRELLNTSSKARLDAMNKLVGDTEWDDVSDEDKETAISRDPKAAREMIEASMSETYATTVELLNQMTNRTN